MTAYYPPSLELGNIFARTTLSERFIKIAFYVTYFYGSDGIKDTFAVLWCGIKKQKESNSFYAIYVRRSRGKTANFFMAIKNVDY